MKKLMMFLLTAAVLNLTFISCERDKIVDKPALPPLESMKIDFSNFSDEGKSATDIQTNANYGWARLNVIYFNIILTGTLVVPVAAFAHSFSQEATFIGDATWQWEYSVPGFAATHYARLTGEVRDNDVKWEMYITKEGVGGFEEFLWFEGTSANDGNSGEWLLYHSPGHPDAFLQIDWQRNGDEMGEVKYTIVRELNDLGTPNVDFNSYVEAGKTDAVLDAYYNIYVANGDRYVDIEWSTTEYNGRIRDQVWFGTEAWKCWDSNGNDVDCE